MDFSRWVIPNALSFSPTGKYLLELPADLPLRLCLYDFSLPHALIPNYHDHLEIACILSGLGRFTVGGKDYSARPGDIFAIPGGVFHLLESAEPEHMQVVTVYFLPDLIYRAGANDLDLEYLLLFLNYQQDFSPRLRLNPRQWQQVLELVGAISDELAARRGLYRIAAKSHLCRILVLLNRAAGVTSARVRRMYPRLRVAHRLKPAFDHIEQHYFDKLSLREIAEASRMSVTNLCRSFKKATGKTVTQYLKRFRIDKAKELLIEDERSITWIASEVGFQSHSYFDRAFHEVTRITPLDYRRRHAPPMRRARK